jgi:hypothetical protein
MATAQVSGIISAGSGYKMVLPPTELQDKLAIMGGWFLLSQPERSISSLVKWRRLDFPRPTTALRCDTLQNSGGWNFLANHSTQSLRYNKIREVGNFAANHNA